MMQNDSITNDMPSPSGDRDLDAGEVIRKEMFPSNAHKTPSERTRPTNPDYTMIEPDGDAVDTSES